MLAETGQHSGDSFIGKPYGDLFSASLRGSNRVATTQPTVRGAATPIAAGAVPSPAGNTRPATDVENQLPTAYTTEKNDDVAPPNVEDHQRRTAIWRPSALTPGVDLSFDDDLFL